MLLIGIDIGKNKHFFCALDNQSGEVIIQPASFTNNKEGFNSLVQKLKPYSRDSVLIGMEDTGHYHFALLKYLLSKQFTVALINPRTTDFTRKIEGSITKNDKLDTLTICDVLDTPERKKQYRITKVDQFELYEQKQLTRQHHNLKEELNIYANRLQKSIDIVFPEFNSLFKSKYGSVYLNVLKSFSSAEAIANSDIRTIRKCFEIQGKGNRISLTAEKLKETAKASIGFSSTAEEIQIRHLVSQIELINMQLVEIDKKIEEYSITNNSPIISIPGISNFSSTFILA
ncbi:IS110 family transposase [Thomasclavelia sp.]